VRDRRLCSTTPAFSHCRTIPLGGRNRASTSGRSGQTPRPGPRPVQLAPGCGQRTQSGSLPIVDGSPAETNPRCARGPADLPQCSHSGAGSVASTGSNSWRISPRASSARARCRWRRAPNVLAVGECARGCDQRAVPGPGRTLDHDQAPPGARLLHEPVQADQLGRTFQQLRVGPRRHRKIRVAP
jgi:hypothetical protein